MSLQTFKDVNKLVKTYPIGNIAQFFSPKRELTFEIEDEELRQLFEGFLEIVQKLLERGNYLSTARGTHEWLDLIDQFLGVMQNIIRIIGEKNYPKYDDDTREIVEFSVDSMINLIQWVQQHIRKQSGLLRKTRLRSPNLKPSILLALTQLEYSIFSIIFTILKVEAKESKPQELYRVVGEALHRTKHLY